LYVEEGGSRDLVRLLAEGVLDLALIILPLHAGDPSLTTRPILEEPLAVADSAREPRSRRASIRVGDLQDHPLVMFRSGYDVRDATLAALRRAGVEPTYAVEGGEMDAVLRFVEAGLGIAVVPSMVLDRRPGLRRIPFAPPGISRTIALAHRRDVDLTAGARVFVSLLVQQLLGAARAKALPKGAALLVTDADVSWS
jgi:DNA-binding transcriptional LysR family regulator